MKNTVLNTTFNIYLFYPIDRITPDLDTCSLCTLCNWAVLSDGGNFYKLLRDYINIGIELQAYLIDWEKMDGLPKSYLYVPASHELFIYRAYQDRFLTKEQISSINCKIIKECNLLINFGSVAAVGDNLAVELKYAQQEKVAIYSMPDLSPMAIQSLRLAIKLIVKAEG